MNDFRKQYKIRIVLELFPLWSNEENRKNGIVLYHFKRDHEISFLNPL